MTCNPFSAEDGLKPEGVFLDLISTINQYSNRWENLRLCCSRELFPLICGNSHGAPMVRRLYLEYPDSSYDRSQNVEFSIPGGQPRPLYVETFHLTFKSLDINWSRATKVYYGTTMSPDECFELLRQAPQLVDCAFISIRDPERIVDVLSTNNISLVHHNLQSLAIDAYKEEGFDLFFGIFIFPNLQRLTLSNGLVSLDCFTNLITRSSCRLTSLTLLNMQLEPYGHLTRLLQETPFLRELNLTDCTFLNSHPLDFFRLLANTSTSDTLDSSQNPILPKLHHLEYVQKYTNSLTWDASLWDVIPSLLGGRYDSHGPQRRPFDELQLKLRIPGFPAKGAICVDRDIVLHIAKALKSGIKLDLRCNHRDILKMSIAHHQIALHSD